MKKLILVVSILTAGIMSANTISPKKNIDKKDSKKAVVTKKTNKSSIVSKVKAVEGDCVVYYSSCGVAASTCQPGWTLADIYHWGQRIEENYCSN